MFTIERFDHLALTVSDLEQSIVWYQDVLGLERHYQDVWQLPVMLCAGDTCLALFPASIVMPHPTPDYERTLTIRHFAFRVDRHNFNRVQESLQQRNMPYEFEDHTISHSIYIYDPDGYRVELTTYEIAAQK